LRHIVIKRVLLREGERSIQLPTADEHRRAEIVEAKPLIRCQHVTRIKNAAEHFHLIDVAVRFLGKAEATRYICTY